MPYRPALHIVQLPDAVDGANWPAGHWVQLLLPPGAYRPALQALQFDAPLLLL